MPDKVDEVKNRIVEKDSPGLIAYKERKAVLDSQPKVTVYRNPKKGAVVRFSVGADPVLVFDTNKTEFLVPESLVVDLVKHGNMLRTKPKEAVKTKGTTTPAGKAE